MNFQLTFIAFLSQQLALPTNKNKKTTDLNYDENQIRLNKTMKKKHN